MPKREMLKHEHEVEVLGLIHRVTSPTSTITTRVDWCPTCKQIFGFNIAFYDGMRRTPEQLAAARQAERDERAAVQAKLDERRAGVG